MTVNFICGDRLVICETKGVRHMSTRTVRRKRMIDEQIDFWRNLFASKFKIEMDLTSLKIPNHVSGFDGLIVVPQGLTVNRILSVLSKEIEIRFEDRSINRIGRWIERDDRTSRETYGVIHRNGIEADPENANLSAVMLKKKNISGQTFTERLLLEFAFLGKMGKRIDTATTTMCSGSITFSRHIPCVDYLKKEGVLYIDKILPDESFGHIRARTVIAFPTVS